MLYILEKAHIKQHIRHTHNGGLVIVHDFSRKNTVHVSDNLASISAPPIVNDFRAGTKSFYVMELLMTGRYSMAQLVSETDQKFGGPNSATVKLFLGDLQKPKGKYSASRGLTLTTDSSGCVSIVGNVSGNPPLPEPPKPQPIPTPPAPTPSPRPLPPRVSEMTRADYLAMVKENYAAPDYADKRVLYDAVSLSALHKKEVWAALQAGRTTYEGWELDYPDQAKGINLTGIRDKDISGGDTGRSGPVTSTTVTAGAKVALQIHDHPRNPNLVVIKGDTFKHKDAIKDVVTALGSKATWNGADGWEVPKTLLTLIMNHSKLAAAFGISKSMLEEYEPVQPPEPVQLLLDFEKSHVKAHTRQTKSGVVQVKDHIDKRTKKVEPDLYAREGKDVHEQHTNVAEVSEMRTSVKGKSDDELKAIAKERGMYVPPAWATIWLNADPEADLQVVGVDKNGKKQYLYTAEHNNRTAGEKFMRLKDFTAQYGKMMRTIKKDMETIEEAKVLYLIAQTAIRIGSERDTKAEVKAYGATTLQSEHVKVGEGGKVNFDFIGKHGVNIKQEVTDHTLANMLKGTSGKVFKTTDSKVRKYMKKAGFGQFDPKDFRTYIGTSMALRVIHAMPAPTDDASYKRAVNDVCKAVSAKLNNTPKMAKNSYIAPEVWDQWIIGEVDERQAA